MDTPFPIHPKIELHLEFAKILAEAATTFAADQRRSFRLARRPRRGRTLRPGTDTPLWNALVAEVQPHLRKYGAQVNLGRVLGLDRQTINAYFVARSRMPDAERTLQLLVWLIASRQGRTPV
jgi:hypothetical protein